MTYHTIIIVGRLGRDPELRYTPTGQAVCSLSVATDRSYTNREGTRVNQTTWFRVSVWGKQAETVNQFLQKGRMVLVEGHLNSDDSGNPRTFTRQDGSVGASYEISAMTVRFLGGRGDVAPGANASAGGTAAPGATTTSSDFDFGDFNDDDFIDF